MSKKGAKAIRILVIILMGLTALITLLGGIGTACVAWDPVKFGPTMAVLKPYQWLYQLMVITNIIAAIVAFRVTFALFRHEKWFYTGALVILIVISALAAIQMIASNALRGNSMPNDFRLYLTVFTLAVLLLLRIPGVWNKIDWTGSAGSLGSPATPAGLALILGGALTLTTAIWAGPSHTINGYNLVNELQLPLLTGGGAMALSGMALLLLSRVRIPALSFKRRRQRSTNTTMIGER
ncbi:MAG TPA: hypothetical protein G4N96_00995 [Chloroflexi bacterium]|nr:hypothetical protein [Chloroflexota bacterium]